MADGGFASMRAGCLSVVPAVAAAVRAVGLDRADHPLDGEHHPDLLRLAFADAWPAVAGSGLDYAVGIRIGGCGRCNCTVAAASRSSATVRPPISAASKLHRSFRSG